MRSGLRVVIPQGARGLTIAGFLRTAGPVPVAVRRLAAGLALGPGSLVRPAAGDLGESSGEVQGIYREKGVIRMAKRSSVKTKILVKVITGHNANGDEVTKDRTFTNANPALTDDDVLAVGQALGGLQSYTVAGVSRNETAVIAAEA